jgi:arylsulfatase B
MKHLFVLFALTLSIYKATAQQNTILIIADDVSPDYFGSFSTLTDTAVAPNIRALANNGVRFTKVWASPYCSPTRAGIFTGRYPFRTGVGQVITNASTPQIDTMEKSIAKLLKWYAPVKYNTACVGKWHLHNNLPNKRLNPNLMGYDFYSGNFNGAITDYYNWARIKNGLQDTVTTYATTQAVNDAVSWLDTINKSKPFFLWLAFNAPHSPYHLPPANLCNTAGLLGTTAHINANPKQYFKAAIEAMDTEIGRLMQYLGTNNLLDSTNIIFIGDNGNAGPVAQITNTSHAKGTLYDYGVRVPLLVSGPVVSNPNRTSEELINTPDLFATIAEMSGFNTWNSAIANNVVVDSKSFLSILKNQNTNKRSWIFTEQFATPATAADGKTIRNEDYHLIKFDNGSEAFYNQTIDKEETTNLLLANMTGVEIQNYITLCDTITSLTSLGLCKPLANNIIENKALSFVLGSFSNHIKIINTPQNANIVLRNIYGQIIYAGLNIEHQNFSYLTNGLYLLTLDNKTFKLMKE